MIYFCIPESQISTANQWVRDNADKRATETFKVNKKDGMSARYAIASIVDNGSIYAEAMKEHFDFTEDVDNYFKSSKGANARALAVSNAKGGGKLAGKDAALEVKASNLKNIISQLGDL